MKPELETTLAYDTVHGPVAKAQTGCHDCENPDCKRRLVLAMETAVGMSEAGDMMERDNPVARSRGH